MPGGDRTGPAGLGPMTGRGAGYCAGLTRPGYAGTGRGFAPGPGFGFGTGFGYGGGSWSRGFCGRRLGRRNWFFATGLPGWVRFGGDNADVGKPVPTSEAQELKNEIERLRAQLCAIDKRLAELGLRDSAEEA